MPAYTKDQIAQAIIDEGLSAREGGADDHLDHPPITERGIVIALATGLVESGLKMYANHGDPESLDYPHDAISTDANSTGVFQQRAPWWGTVADRMDPARSAALFYRALAKLDYNGPATPGSYAQTVQQSAFPDRYDKRIPDAQALYDLFHAQGTPTVPENRPDFNEFPMFLSGNSHERDTTGIDLWLLHTQEPPQGSDNRNDAALELRNFLESTKGTKNPVAYHYTGSQANDGGTTIVDCVDTDDAAWSVGNSNNRSINFAFAGTRSDWTRDQWLDNERGTIAAAAYLFVQDCRKYPSLQIRVIAPDYSDPPGAADHKYCTEFLRDGNDHTDVGPNFPWDVFANDVQKYSTEQPPAEPAPPAPPPDRVFPRDYTDRELLEWVVAQLGPGDPNWHSKDMTLRDKVWTLTKDLI